jgi:hypothetical protein
VRLDHLLSKEHTARSEAFVFGLPGSSYVEYWPTRRHVEPRPRCTSQLPLLSGARAAGPSPAPPRRRAVRPSLLCFEEAASTRAVPFGRGPAFGSSGRPCSIGRSGAVPLSPAPERSIPPPARRAQKVGKRLGWNFENCIASTSVLEIRCGPWWSIEFSARSKTRGLCDFKL